MKEADLGKLTKAVREFFSEFASMNLKDLPEGKVQALLHAHELTVEAIMKKYARRPV